LLCRWLSPLGSFSPAWLRPMAALFVDVPDFTRMPAVPLAAWLALGTLLGTSTSLLSLGLSDDFERRAGARVPRVLGLGLCVLRCAGTARFATGAVVQRLGEPFTRAHPAVVLNVIDLGARGALVLALGLLLGGVLADRVGRVVARLGQASLWMYVAHL